VSIPDLGGPFDASDAAAQLAYLGLSSDSVWWYIATLAPFGSKSATTPHRVQTNAAGSVRAADVEWPPPGRLAAWAGYGYILFGVETLMPGQAAPTPAVSLRRVERGEYFLPLLCCRGLYADRTTYVIATLFGVFPSDAQGGALLTARPDPWPPSIRRVGEPPTLDEHTQRRVSGAWTLLHTFTRETRGRRAGRDITYGDVQRVYWEWVDDLPGARREHCAEKPRPSQDDLAHMLATSASTVGRVANEDPRGWPPPRP
jgi:hypothetical protein